MQVVQILGSIIKIDEENKQVKGDETLVTLKNFKEKIGDLLGI